MRQNLLLLSTDLRRFKYDLLIGYRLASVDQSGTGEPGDAEPKKDRKRRRVFRFVFFRACIAMADRNNSNNTTAAIQSAIESIHT